MSLAPTGGAPRSPHADTDAGKGRQHDDLETIGAVTAPEWIIRAGKFLVDPMAFRSHWSHTWGHVERQAALTTEGE